MMRFNNKAVKWFFLIVIPCILGLSGCTLLQEKASIRSYHLRCEHKTDPLGIDVPKPRLSWNLAAVDERQRGLRQTAYQILVADDKDKLSSGIGDLWNSGKVNSDQTTEVVYDGKALTSGIDCWWTVRVWDNTGRASAWSEPARWSMGLLNPEDWKAQWIGYVYKANTDPKLPQATYWRKEIEIGKEIGRAMLYASALGDYVLSINGKRVGEDYFNPGWPEFEKRIYYHTYDVTSMLQEGQNALGGILSTGWYAGYIWAGPFNYGKIPKLLVQLNIQYADGTTQVFKTDSSWKVFYGPLIEADIQQGETYDARLEIANWNTVACDDTGWADPDVVLPAVPVQIEKGNVTVPLYAAPHPPVRRQREIRPVKMSQPKSGVYIFDLGESIAGWARLKVKGSVGTKVVMHFSGMLNPDGTLYTEYLREAGAKDTYILIGSEGEEVWEPLFTYHGFQYVEVTGYPGVPTLDSITGVVCNSDVERTGYFMCSDERVNKLYKNCIDTMLANVVDLIAGCSDRAERLGWMGTGQMFYSLSYLFDMDAFFTKWMTDMVDAQSLGTSGTYLQCSPMWGDAESPGWSDDGVCVPYTLYRFYGDRRIIENNYKSLTTYLDHIERNLTDYLRTGPVYHPAAQKLGEKFIGYGDWVAIVEDRERHYDVLNTLWNGWSVSNMAEMAKAVGKNDDALKYQQLLAKMKNAFDKAYISADGKVRDDIQSEYALGLYFGFIRDDKIPLCVKYLADDILNKSHTQMRPDALGKNPVIPPGHLTTGFHGTRALLPVLSRYGRNDVAYKLLLEDTYPSWLYCVKNGATSVWERWDSWMPEKGFQDPRMNSFGMPHLMASVVEWLMGYAGGIQPESPGFKDILIKPYPGEGLSWVDVSYNSVNGRIVSKWQQQKDGSLTLQVTIPPNTMARVCVSKNGMKSVIVCEGGVPVWINRSFSGKVKGITGADEDSDYVNFQVESGGYDFRIVRDSL